MWSSDFVPAYIAQPLLQPSLFFIFDGDQLLVDAQGCVPEYVELPAKVVPLADLTIGHLGNKPCRAVLWPAGAAVPAGFAATNLRQLSGILPDGLYGVAARAKQMLWWDTHTRFCGVCGTPTQPQLHEPAKRCPACGELAYPRLSPAMMVQVRRGDELLLAHAPHFKDGMYSALAGFVEAGESVEACVHREVAEEVGLKITSLRWFSSQSWPFPHSLMLAFFADYVSGDITPQAGEIEDARWFGLHNLPELPGPASIAHHLIHAAIAEIQSEG